MEPNQQEEERASSSSSGQYCPPWKEAYVISIAGSSGSGKTSVAKDIIRDLNIPNVLLLSMDNFYKPLRDPKLRKMAFESNYDFDSPTAIDMDMLYEVLRDLKTGKRTKIPIYSFVEHDRSRDKFINAYAPNIIILEGIYALYDPRVLELCNLKVFIDTPLDICLARRLTRDILHRGRLINLSIKQWALFVKPNFEKYMRFTMYNSDIRVPNNSQDTSVATRLLLAHIRDRLKLNSMNHLNSLISLSTPKENKNYHLIRQTNQVKLLNTYILNVSTPRDEFIFYFNRMAMLLVTAAIDFLDDSFYKETIVTTPTGTQSKSVIPIGRLATVLTIRGGGSCFDSALRQVLDQTSSAGSGRILIQSDLATGEPQLHAVTLPPKIGEPGTRVFLFDTQLSTGVAAIMAISVLLDHGVSEQDVTIVCYMAAEMGITRVGNAYPNVKIVSAVKEKGGISKFVENKYYGTR